MTSFLFLIAWTLPVQATGLFIEGGFDTINIRQGSGPPSASCDGCTTRMEGDRLVVTADRSGSTTVVTGPGSHSVVTIGPNTTSTTTVGSITSIVTGPGATSRQTIGGNTSVIASGGGGTMNARAEISVPSLEALRIVGSAREMTVAVPVGRAEVQGVFDALDLGRVRNLTLAVSGNGTVTVASLDGPGRVTATGGGTVTIRGGGITDIQAKSIGQSTIRVLGRVGGGSAQCIGAGAIEMPDTSGPVGASRIGMCRITTR